MAGGVKSSLSKLRLVITGSPRAVWLTSFFAVAIIVLLFFLWQQVQSVSRILLPVGHERTGPDLSAIPSGNAQDVLILNSYHMGYSWSDNEMDGIIGTLRESHFSIRPIVEYLDCKRFPSMEHFDRLRDLFTQKYHGRKFGVVIAADNPALRFALKYRPQLFPGASIIFCGINGFRRDMIDGYDKVTGVAELLDAGGTVNTALRLHPQTRQIEVVYDYSITGLSTRRETEEQLKDVSGAVRIRYMENMTTTELMRNLRTLPPDSLVLALSYSLDKEGHVFNLEKIAKLLSLNSPVPVYGLHEERLGYGIVGGSLLGGRPQGVRAGEIALRILSGTPVSEIPVDLKSPTRMMFDYNQLVRFGIPLSSLPTGSVIVNKPVSFFAQYRALAVTTVLLILVLVSGVLILGVNIYRRRIAEEARIDSERNFKTLFESAGDAIFIEDMDERCIDANEEAARSTGYSRAELRALSLRDITEPAFLGTLAESRKGLLGAGRAFFEAVHMTKEGKSFPVELNCRLIDYSGKRAVLAVARDISERIGAEKEQRYLQAQLLQSRKMESVGRLAGGVAHDFNNILTSILGYCEILMSDIPAGHPMSKQLDIIRSAGERGAGLTRQLLAFSRKQVLQMKSADLNAIIENMAKMISRIIGEDIRFELRLKPVKNILADTGQIEQVLMNLIANARDAMPDGGRLLIETGNELLDRRYAEAHEGVRPGIHVMLAVSDTGRGMSAEMKERIFEPFFTTKGTGKGTGLGLATVYGIVRQHNGHIHVDSEPGRGTSFKVYLPATDESVQPDEQLQSGPPAHGKETLLVVDDDAMIVEMIEKMLQPLGYTVLTANGSEEALAINGQYEKEIHVLLTDVIMQSMNGRELSDALKQRRPGMSTIFMSGYTDNIIAHKGVLEPGMVLLQKPLTQRLLARSIREVIDRSR
ncbi:MAG: ATP-binding protein [Nitrospiraceae bacterium]|nr:ATP-binding protein [Nitrospiraceae bacterium]